jgi:hypothetical protein
MGCGDEAQRAAHTVGMPVRLHHIVVDAHDLPGLVRFWTQARGWKVLSDRENEIVIGTEENAPVGMCFMPATDPKTVKNRVHLDFTSSAADRERQHRERDAWIGYLCERQTARGSAVVYCLGGWRGIYGEILSGN